MTRMTRMRRISADPIGEHPRHPRHPRSPTADLPPSSPLPEILVAEAVDRDDQRGMLGVRLDLSTQPSDVHVDRSREHERAVPPHGVEQLVARHDLALVAHEMLEDSVLE